MKCAGTGSCLVAWGQATFVRGPPSASGNDGFRTAFPFARVLLIRSRQLLKCKASAPQPHWAARPNSGSGNQPPPTGIRARHLEFECKLSPAICGSAWNKGSGALSMQRASPER